ncbi:MAG: hypothetical protein OEW12_03010, partial [Deltaproteobacteria bacterium]|nr:hypothetical protein [Deltaproteobacteria bacterium]
IAEVSKGSNDLANNSGEAANAANEVSKNITGVIKVIGENSSGITQVANSSGDLSKIAQELDRAASRFKVD